MHLPLIRLFLLPASFDAKQIIDFSRPFPHILHTSALPVNKTTPVATQTSFMQVNRRHSSFTLRQASLTPSRQQPNESRAARTSSSSHLAHSGTVYAAATQVRRGTERVYAESQVWRFNLIFLRWLSHLSCLQFKTDGERVYNSTSQSSSFPQPLYQVTFQFIPALASRLLCCCRLACSCTISQCHVRFRVRNP